MHTTKKKSEQKFFKQAFFYSALVEIFTHQMIYDFNSQFDKEFKS